MSRYSSLATLAAVAILWCGASASAETLRCQSVNGNLNCAGSGGVSCQTVNGKKICTSGHGDVVQSFGSAAPSGDAMTLDDSMGEDDGVYDAPVDPAMKQRLERRDSRGKTLLLQRDGTSLHLRSNWLSIDRD